MKRLTRIAEPALFALCVAFVALALLLVVVDVSGVLRNALHERARELLAPHDADLELEAARLHWSDPSLRLDGVRLIDRRGDEVLALDSIRLHFSVLPPRVAGVEIAGASLTLGLGARELVEAWRERARPAEAKRAGGAVRAPWLEVEGVELRVDSRGLVDLQPAWVGPLCTLSLSSSASGVERAWLRGEIVPEPRPGRRLSPIRFSGAVDPTGRIAVQADSTDLDVDISALPEFIARRAALFGPWRAKADLEFGAIFEGLDPVPVDSDLRLRVDDFRPLDESNTVAPTDVSLVARASFDSSAGPDGQLLSIVSETRGHWRSTPFEVGLRAGRAAPAGTALEVRAELPRLPLDETTYAVAEELLRGPLGLTRSAQYTANTIDALGVEGSAEVRLDFRRERAVTPQAPARNLFALRATPREGTLLRYLGWPDEKQVIGFPAPVAAQRGRVLVSVDSGAERAVQVGFNALGGPVPGGEASFDGLIQTAPYGMAALEQRPHLRFSLDVPSMDVTTGARVGLQGLGLEEFDVLERFDPRGGSLRGRMELERRPDERLPLISLDLDLEGVGARWNELPAPIHDLMGEVDLRMSRSIASNGTSDGGRRAIGVAVGLEGRVEAGGEVRVRVGVRDPLERREDAPDDGLLRQIEVDVTDAELAGTTRAALDQLESVRAVLDRTGVAGTLEARVRSARWSPERPRALRIEVEPVEARLLPTASTPGVEQLRGAVSIELPKVPGNGAGFAALAAGHLEGSAPGAASVEASLRLDSRLAPPAAALSLELAAHGVDPLHPAWPEYLATLEDQAPALALKRVLECEPRGQIDLELEFRADRDSQLAQPPRLTAHLRSNRARVEGLTLEDLRGAISTDGVALDSERLDGVVAGRKVGLSSLQALPADQVGRLDRATRELLARTAPGRTVEGLVTADVALVDTLIDDELVAELTGAEQPSDWQILIDTDGTRLLLASDVDGRLALGASGTIRPHDVRFRPNLRISTIELDVGHAVLDDAGVRALGEVRRGFGDVSGLGIEDASGIVSYVGDRLTLEGLSAGFAGGRISGQQRSDGLLGGRAASVELRPPYRFDLALAFDSIDVNQVLSQVIVGDGTDAGRLRGHMRLVGEPNDPLSLEGEGFLAIDNARLYSIPVIRDLFKQLGFDATATFDWMRTRVQVAEGRIEMQDAVAHTPLLKLVGRGALGVDGSLDHEFDIAYSLVDKVPLLSRLFYWLQSRLLRVSILGDMTRPRVILTNPLLDLVGRSRPRPPRLPYPRSDDLPDRF